MKITKFISIEQEVEIDLSIEDLVLIFDEEIDPDRRRHLFSQLNSIYRFLKALPDKFFEGLSGPQKKMIYSQFSEIIERFNPAR